MGIVVAFTVFAGALIASIWVMIATIAPKFAYIRDLFSGRALRQSELPELPPLRGRVTIAPARRKVGAPYWRAAA
ncbi:hypothetical protein EV664_101290 [Stakelama pacifica]|uniref:Uncharacterized protein n=2 Tax=Stakelama pacifica TaxID=517720 RepID=A0A4R6FZV0_9SPHN|nr:hypothetical protein EV664_101290 [Stakelama pacifica]GGO90456.1 hypothetical protein GCM10011329_02830 [Stakelama pacifica]